MLLKYINCKHISDNLFIQSFQHIKKKTVYVICCFELSKDTFAEAT